MLKSSKFDRVSLEKSKIEQIGVSESSEFDGVSLEKLEVRFFHLKQGIPPSAFTEKPNGFWQLSRSEVGFPLQKVMVF